MKNTIKLFAFAILTGISFLSINAQESTIATINESAVSKTEKSATAGKQSSNDEINKWEIYGGYSWMKPTEGTIAFSSDDSTNGYDISVTRNFHRFVGVKFATTGSFKTTKDVFQNGTDTQNNSFFTYAGGIQFKDNRKSNRVKPFAHVLIGGMRYNYKFTSTFSSPGSSSSESVNNFLAVVGGGVDIRVGKKISLRPIQFDYFITNGGKMDLVSKGFIRLGAGINFNF